MKYSCEIIVLKTEIMKLNIITFTLILLVIGCQSQGGSESQKIPSEGKYDFSDKKQIISLIESWNNANSIKDIGALSNMYSENINFYGKNMSKNECLKNKISFFEKNSSFTQTIEGEISVTKIDDTKIKGSFNKKVYLSGSVKYYPSYIEFSNEGGNWKIITEGDLITDENIAHKSRTENDSKSILSCEDAIISICKTAPSIKKQLRENLYLEVDSHDGDVYSIHFYGVGSDATFTLGWYQYNIFSNKLYDTMTENELDFDREYGLNTAKICK